MPDAFLRKVAPADAAAAPATYGAGLVFLPQRRRRTRGRSSSSFARIVAEEGQQLLGWRDVPTDDSPGRPERRRGRAGVRAGVHRRGSASAGSAPIRETRARVRAQAVRDPQADRARGRSRCDARRTSRKLFYIASLSCEHADLQGHADGEPDRDDVPGSDAIRISRRRWRSCTSASARTRSRRGRSRTRTATSRTTARSTR